MVPDQDTLLHALEGVRLGTVLLFALVFTFAFAGARPAPSHDGPITQVVVKVVKARTAAILVLVAILAFTYFIDGAGLVVVAVLTHVWEGHTAQWHWLEYADIAGLAALTALLTIGAYKETRDIDLWTKKRVRFLVFLGLIIDFAQLRLITLTADFHAPREHTDQHVLFISNILHVSTVAARVLFYVPLFAVLALPRVSYVNTHESHVSEEAHAPQSAFLLPPSPSHTNYGTFSHSHQPSASGTVTPAPSEPGPPQSGSRKAPMKPTPKKEVELDPSWSEIARRVRRVLPYLWPWRSFRLQGLAVLCMLLVLAGRFVNVGIPFSLGEVVANLEAWRTSGASFWPPLLLYVGLRWGASALGTLEEMLWQPIMQYSDREMAQLSFDHILNLSLSYHTHRKTGEVLRILDRGSAINHVFELVLFSIVPTVLDIIIGLAVFWITYDATLSLVVAAVFVAYITASISLTTTRTKLRRRMNEADIVTRGIHTDCLLNYETVKYFGNERHEQQRYRDAVLKYQSLEYKVIAYLNLLNIVQNTIISIGLLVGSVIVALRIVRDKQSATGFIVFVTYLAQLYGPLNNLGYIYRSLNQSLVDTEKLLKLLDEPVDVQDKPGAPDLVVTDGEIEFENVSFSYGGNSQALNGVSFKIAKGQSVALVGQTGSGKSTALRLLYRFYDLADGQGRILIDGQDIRNVTQSSLRKAIGVVPQDSVLFNSTIEYNIRYGKLDADFEEVVAASRAAQMHDRILTFQDGYQTTVGERGVRLSGGEKQRVAIARTLLKNPPVLLLDEATSALDTNTERDIQNALQNLMRGRSSLSIAHRLSTIAAADLILVLKDGQIIEQGNIRELIASNGEFASMWAEQVKTDEDAQLLANLSGDIKQEYAESVRAPPSIKPSMNSIRTQAREVAREEGYILDQAIPAEAAALAGNLPSAAIEADSEDAKVEPEGYRTESPLPLVSSQDQDRATATDLPATTEYAAPEAATTSDQYAPTTAPIAFAPESPAKWDESAPFVAAPPEGAAPVSFPAGDDQSLRRSGSTANSLRPSAHGQTVSFGPELDRPPSRHSNPPDTEDKPKRTAAQNLSKFAKRIVLARRVSAALSTPSQPSTPPVETPQASTPLRNSTEGPESPSPVPGATPNEEGTSSVRNSMFRRKDTAVKEDKDKPPARRRTTLSFSRPKAPRPEGSS